MFNLRDPVLLTVQDQKRLLFSPAQPFTDKAICLTLQHSYVLWLMMRQSSSSLIKKKKHREINHQSDFEILWKPVITLLRGVNILCRYNRV